ncbi:MAG: glycosyltransferase [Alphaproteobacteria bacterium]
MLPKKNKPDLYPASQPRKKVLFVLPRLYPGGAERVLITLMNNLDRALYDIEFVSLSGEGTIKHWIDNDIPICALHKKRVSSSIVALYQHIRQIKPDSVVSTMVHCNAALLILKPFFKNTRFIVRESSLPKALIEEYGWKGKVCTYIYKYLYPKADAVISPAQMITDEFKDYLRIKTHNHYTLPNPVNVERLQSTLKESDADSTRHKTQHFVCVGRLGYEKGYDRLIEALADYEPPEGINWQLKIIGKGSETKYLGDLIRKLKLHNHIKLAGYQNIPWPDIAQADCLLLPSRWEGMPNVALEALACGTNVIGHKEAGGISEIAKASKDEDVQVFDNMQDFVSAMSRVKPMLANYPAQSKLPEAFELQNVMQAFQKIL